MILRGPIAPPSTACSALEICPPCSFWLKLRTQTNSTMEIPKMNTLFGGNVLYSSTVSSKSANISPNWSPLNMVIMGFKMILGAYRLLKRGWEDEFAPLVVHWSTKKCKNIKNLSAPKCTFIHIKMILSVSWLSWTPSRVAILVLVAEKMEKTKKNFRNLQ